MYSEFLNDEQQFQMGNLEGFARILIELIEGLFSGYKERSLKF